MNKLEDIKLKIGDKITFEDESIDYVSFECDDINIWNKCKIAKIERYKKLTTSKLYSSTELLKDLYILETIYEKPKETLTEKEKEYLRAVIENSFYEVTTVCKRDDGCGEKVWLVLDYKNDYSECLQYMKNDLFKSMRTNKKYTIEELGL